MLARHGYAVTTSGSVEEGAALLGDGGHDAIVTDLHPPVLAGLDLVRIVRERTPGTPAMILTAARAGEAAPAADLGVPVMAKPFPVAALVVCVDGMVAGSAGLSVTARSGRIGRDAAA